MYENPDIAMTFAQCNNEEAYCKKVERRVKSDLRHLLQQKRICIVTVTTEGTESA